MANGMRKEWKGLLCALLWAGICLASGLMLRAIQWGAGEGSAGAHLRFGLAYSLSGGKIGLLILGLLCLAAGFGTVWALKEEKKIYWPGVVLGLFFAGMTLIHQSPTGMLENLWAFPEAGSAESLLFWLTGGLCWYGAVLLFCRLLNRPRQAREPIPRSRKRMLLWAGVLLLCWLPILILRSPGSIYADTDAQILQFQGVMPYEASNPLILSFVYGPLFTLGQGIGGDNWGIFCCVIFQTLLGLFACGFACEELTAQRGTRKAGALLCAFFGLVPAFASFCAAALKDFIHAPVYLLFVLYYCRTARGGSRGDWLRLAILALLAAATRKGAVFLVAFSLLGLALLKGEKRKILTVGTLALLAVHFLLNGLLFPLIGVEKPMEQENYSFFYPITGFYCARYDGELTEAEKQTIAAVLDYDTVVSGFSTGGVDTIKRTYHAENETQVRAYLALHGKFFLRHPLTCLEALVYSRNDYFTPWSVRGERISVAMHPFREVDPKADSNFSHWLPEDTRKAFEDKLWAATDTFPLKELISPGTYTWLTLLLLAAAWKQKNRQRLVELLPLALLTAGLLLTHLNGAARYASPLYYCVPVVLGLDGGAS